jgi:hypothetical protein
LLEVAARALEPLLHRLVFVGGSIVELLITDPQAPECRGTVDAAVVVSVQTRGEYYALVEEVRACGFSEAIGEAVACRFRGHGIILDVVPDRQDVLGFSNPWYREAVRHVRWMDLPSGITIQVVDAAHFVATKFQAFEGRGNGDYFLSHDFEDIVLVLAGRPECLEELRDSDLVLREYVSEQLRKLVLKTSALEALEGALSMREDAYKASASLLQRLREFVGTNGRQA